MVSLELAEDEKIAIQDKILWVKQIINPRAAKIVLESIALRQEIELRDGASVFIQPGGIRATARESAQREKIIIELDVPKSSILGILRN